MATEVARYNLVRRCVEAQDRSERGAGVRHQRTTDPHGFEMRVATCS
jgi:hypothetical protein